MTGDADSTRLVDEVGRALRALVRPGSGVLLAVSGGSDSIGLMHLAHSAAPELGLELAVGFVDHGLRSGVDAEWDLVSGQARSLGLEARRADVPRDQAAAAQDRGSLQQWAREARYRELRAMASGMGLARVATGHTLDDQAETVLLRLIRGTGIDGLGGILPSREIGEGIDVVRPLLGLARADIRGFLAARDIPWADDPSNADQRFLRVRVRRELLPGLEGLQPGIARRLAALADEARGASRFLERYLSDEKLYENIRLSDGVKVEHQVFENLPASAWTRLVRLVLRRVRGDLWQVERSHLSPIEDLIRSAGSGGPLPLPGEAEVHVYRGTLFAFPGPLPGRPSGSGQPAAAGPGLWTARFAALGAIAEIRAGGPDEVEDLEVRARRPGDRLLGSERKLKELLSERRVPRPYRDFVPVLASGDRIVACPGLLRSRRPGVEVNWLLDDGAPLLDIGFPQMSRC